MADGWVAGSVIYEIKLNSTQDSECGSSEHKISESESEPAYSELDSDSDGGPRPHEQTDGRINNTVVNQEREVMCVCM